MPTLKSTSTSGVNITISPTEILSAEITPAIKATELLRPTPSLAEMSVSTAVRQLSGPYLGQEPPGMEQKIFAPGIVSDPNFTEWSGAFSPDGSEYYFYRFSETSKSRILYTKVVNGKWIVPEQLAITAGYDAYQPYVSVDNHWFFFKWNHPTLPSQPNYGVTPYFSAERTQDGWSQPQYAGQGMYLSSTSDGQLYTTDMSSFKHDGKTYLVKITVDDGTCSSYERLPIHSSWGNPAYPCIASDGSYILIDVSDEDNIHLFVSFKNSDGSWGDPIDLTKYDLPPMADGAYISPDGKYLFFF